jgi:methyl-accepting chemotaxis protein
MRDIVESVEGVSSAIEQLRLAANDQYAGINLISNAMAGIDDATQKNAAMVEESAAGAKSLEAEVEHLRHAIAIFQVDVSD